MLESRSIAACSLPRHKTMIEKRGVLCTPNDSGSLDYTWQSLHLPMWIRHWRSHLPYPDQRCSMWLSPVIVKIPGVFNLFLQTEVFFFCVWSWIFMREEHQPRVQQRQYDVQVRSHCHQTLSYLQTLKRMCFHHDDYEGGPGGGLSLINR